MSKIYLYRRIGNQEWATCDEPRFIELSSHKLFTTKICYDEPAAPTAPIQPVAHYKIYTTQPAESLAGMAARQLKDERRWIEIRDANALEFPDMGPSDYYPVGSAIRIPPLSPDHSGGVTGKVVLPERSFTDGIEDAAKFVEKRMDDYINEHGSFDPETGAVELPGNGEEYVGELAEISEAIRALDKVKELNQ